MPVDNLNSEPELLFRVAEGDEQAFAELVRKYDSLVFSFIHKFVPSVEVVEEMVSDIFLQIWLTREALADINNFGTYLYVISRNYAFNALKKELRQQKRHQEWMSSVQDQDENVEREDRVLNLVEQAVQELPLQQQRVWILRRRQRKSYSEIEAELKISRNTVKTHLRTANNTIKEYVLKRIKLITGLFL